MMKQYKFIKHGIDLKQIGICSIAFIFLMCIIFFSEKSIGFGKSQSIIFVTVVLLLLFGFGIYCFAKVEFAKWTFIFLLIAGTLSLLIQPILNIPDEGAHLARAEYVSEGKLLVDVKDTEFEVIQSVADLQKYIKVPYTKTELKGKAINYEKAMVKHIAAGNFVVLYFPQAIGILIAKFFNLHVIWMLWLGRFVNLLVYCIIVSVAISLATRWKMMLFFMASLPMSIQQAASFSPDALINAVCILYIGLFIHLYCKEKKTVTKGEMAILIALSILIPIFKVSNILIVGLVLLLPMDNITSKKSVLIKIFIIFIACIAAVGYYWHTTQFAPNMEQSGYLKSVGADSAGQIQYILTNIGVWIKYFISSLINQFEGIIGSLNNFGWLSYQYSILNMVSIFMFSKICFQEKGIGLNKIGKLLILLMGIGTYTITCLALYISWTPVGSTEIVGMQGRYLIPMLTLISMMFSGEKNKNENKNNTIDVTVICSMLGAMFIITATQYY